MVRFVPEIKREAKQREIARQFAVTWRTGQGRYCFTTDLERVSRMIEAPHTGIDFLTLYYEDQIKPVISTGAIGKFELIQYAVGDYLTQKTSGDKIRETLRKYKVSGNGRKEVLTQRLAKLAVKVYGEKQAEMNRFFSAHQYVRKPPVEPKHCSSFPLLGQELFDQLILAMYILKHLRGNAILDAGYSDDTYELADLARALIREEISVDGVFLQVE